MKDFTRYHQQRQKSNYLFIKRLTLNLVEKLKSRGRNKDAEYFLTFLEEINL